MKTLYVPLAVDQNYRELNLGKQIAVALLNLDLERKERLTKASLIGWPILLKKVGNNFLILDSTMTISSKIIKYIYPNYNDIAKEISSVNTYEDFMSKLKISLEKRSSAEISLTGLLNLDVTQLIKVSKEGQYPLFVLDNKIIDHDINLINDNLISLKTEAIGVITSLEVLLREVDNTRVRIKQNLVNMQEDIKKKYSVLLEEETKKIEAELQKISAEILSKINDEFNKINQKLPESLLKYSINTLKYEGGIIEKSEFEKSQNEFENLLNELRKIRDKAIESYLKEIRNYRNNIENMKSKRNSEIEEINNKIREMDNAVKSFVDRSNNIKRELESFISYIDSFRVNLTLTDDTIIIIPFLLAVTNKGRRIVVPPQVYKGKAQGVLNKLFKKSELSTPLMDLRLFSENIRGEFEDNVKVKSQDVNIALKEIDDEGWKSLESIDDIYAS